MAPRKALSLRLLVLSSPDKLGPQPVVCEPPAPAPEVLKCPRAVLLVDGRAGLGREQRPLGNWTGRAGSEETRLYCWSEGVLLFFVVF